MSSFELSKVDGTVLLVEDNAEYARMVESAVGECGVRWAVHRVRNGPEALRYLHAQDAELPPGPSLVVLDGNLPAMHGLELLETIRAHETTRAIPVIVFSSSNSRDDVQRAYRQGANCYVQKPANADGLVGLMRILLDFWFGTVQLPCRHYDAFTATTKQRPSLSEA